MTQAAKTAAAARPRLGAVSFLHRIGSALNRRVHLHACVTDGVFMPPATGTATDAPPVFLPARPITQADLTAVTEKVRRRLIRWLRRQEFLDAEAADFLLRQKHSGFSVDASVRIALIDRDVPSYFRSLEHLLRYCTRPPFALERLSVSRDASDVVDLTPFEFLDRLADLVPPPRRHRHRYHVVFAPNHRLRKAVTSLAKRGTSASGERPRPAGMRVTGTAREAAATRITRRKSPARTTRRGLRGPR